MINTILEKEENNFLEKEGIKKRFIEQRHDWDCGVACLAMITDTKYEEIGNLFKPNSCNNIQQKGISYASIIRYLTSKSIFSRLESKKEISLKKINQEIDNGDYLIILKKDCGYTHFCYIHNKILFDSEEGLCLLDDDNDLKDYIDYTVFNNFKYLTKIFI